MSIDAGAILRAAISFAVANASDIVNVYHLVMTGEDDVSNAQAVLDCKDYIINIMNQISALYPDALTVNDVQVWSLNFTTFEWESIGSTGSIWTGSQGTVEYLPAQVGPLFRANTTNAKSKGRKYLPPVTEAAVSEGILTAATLSTLGDALAEYIDSYVSGARTYTPGVWSPTDTVFYAFSGPAVVGSLPGTQRRRKEGVGA